MSPTLAPLEELITDELLCHANPPRDPQTPSTPRRASRISIQPASRPVINRLPHVLASIRPDESLWAPDGIFPLHQSINILTGLTSVLELLKHAISENPFFLGKLEHIRVRNSSGSTAHLRVVAPPRNSPPPKRWYVVACGTKVGIFLSWLELLISPNLPHRLITLQVRCWPLRHGKE